MNKLYFLLVLFLASHIISAQELQVVENSIVHTGRIGSVMKVPVTLVNTSDRPIYVAIKRTNKVIGTSQKSYFCWGNECYSEETDKLPLSKRLEPGEKSSAFVSVLEAGLAEGISTVNYQIYNRDNPMDYVEYEITYSVEDKVAERFIYESRAIRINDVYPNPVTEFAFIDYNILDRDVEAKVVIHNVLGSAVAEYDLPYLETRVKVNADEFNAGVYFYTLYVDNEGVMSRKLIVRK
ncbi:T9SS type A sorting domain-containing protein [Fulvivirga sedimenti]|uniref:T9SS type A sorting domain-containing protein n=1 Tax=Fulvivirga sedimenti TaxID=2879465 RepID=A0A9X1HPP1_9BACT|nr:T9SS type A sorting domain-containing protein [Fulvivirga sedimenti]MCA6073912.1 T9SS type A sorting domain-containing protein [Fulvivirga sedimenti]